METGTRGPPSCFVRICSRGGNPPPPPPHAHRWGFESQEKVWCAWGTENGAPKTVGGQGGPSASWRDRQGWGRNRGDSVGTNVKGTGAQNGSHNPCPRHTHQHTRTHAHACAHTHMHAHTPELLEALGPQLCPAAHTPRPPRGPRVVLQGCPFFRAGQPGLSLQPHGTATVPVPMRLAPEVPLCSCTAHAPLLHTPGWADAPPGGSKDTAQASGQCATRPCHPLLPPTGAGLEAGVRGQGVQGPRHVRAGNTLKASDHTSGA